MPSPFAEVLSSLRGTFEQLEVDWYVFGAQAALVHGAVRMTADVDVTVFPGDLTMEALVEALEANGFELRGVETDFVRETRVLPLVHLETGINADVVIGGPGIEESFRSRAEPVDLGGTIVPVAAAEDVVAMKILGGRSKDREDVVAIIAAQGPSLNYNRIRATLELLEKALDRSDLVVELGRARAEATR
ncbi:MAG: hypothetical protein PVH21_04540 [Myxococcales bacterium]|jgi:hypothetical protein